MFLESDMTLKMKKNRGGGTKYQASIHDSGPRNRRVGMKLSVHESSVLRINPAPECRSMPGIRHRNGSASYCHTAHVERSEGLPWQGRPADRSTVSARGFRSNTSPQRTRICIRAGGLHSHAAERRKRSDAQSGGDFL